MISSMRRRFKMLSLLNFQQRRTAYWLLFLMLIGMLLEMLGISLIIPIIMLLLKADPFTNAPAALQEWLETLGSLPHDQLVSTALILWFALTPLKARSYHIYHGDVRNSLLNYKPNSQTAYFLSIFHNHILFI